MTTAIQYAKKICYSSPQVLDFSYEMAVRYKNSNAIFVEAGVAAGAQIIAMLAGAPGHEVWAFDSFEGIPLPSNRDDQMPGIQMLSKTEQKMLPDPGKQALVTTGATSVSQEDFLQHVKNALPNYYDYQSLIIFNGWFEEIMPKVSEKVEPIAILRLDGDLYNSTWVCLQHLFPKVIQGGCVIIDDYELLGCRDACKEYFELIGYEPDYKFIEGKDYRVAYFFK